MTRLTLSLLLLPALAMAGTVIQTVATKNPKVPLEAIEPPPVPPGWTIGAGVIWRQIGELEFRGGHRAHSGHVPKLKSKAHSTGGGGSGGNYSDGYVLPDSTGGLQTWNWGYNSASQVSGNNLSFSSRQSVITHDVSALHLAHGWRDDLEGTGLYLSLETPDLRKWKNFSVSLSGSYSFVQDESSYEGEVFRAASRAYRQSSGGTDVYDISAIAPIPGAPHNGTFDGPGPVISLNPVSSTGGRGSGAKKLIEEEFYVSRIQQSIEVRLHTLSLGPNVAAEWGKVQAILSAGLALNIADWEAQSQETLSNERSGKVIRQWTDSTNRTELLLGAYAELGARWQFLPRWSLNATARYDWSQDLSGQAGPSKFDLALGGFSAMLGLGWNF